MTAGAVGPIVIRACNASPLRTSPITSPNQSARASPTHGLDADGGGGGGGTCGTCGGGAACGGDGWSSVASVVGGCRAAIFGVSSTFSAAASYVRSISPRRRWNPARTLNARTFTSIPECP
eukprot:1367976-Pleurochrysis_carterae.AAC.1